MDFRHRPNQGLNPFIRKTGNVFRPNRLNVLEKRSQFFEVEPRLRVIKAPTWQPIHASAGLLFASRRAAPGASQEPWQTSISRVHEIGSVVHAGSFCARPASFATYPDLVRTRSSLPVWQKRRVRSCCGEDWAATLTISSPQLFKVGPNAYGEPGFRSRQTSAQP